MKYPRSVLDRQNPIPRRLQWRMACEAAEGLLAVHAAGLMHRDIKGSNVMLTADNHVSIGDFDCVTDEVCELGPVDVEGWKQGVASRAEIGGRGVLEARHSFGVYPLMTKGSCFCLLCNSCQSSSYIIAE